MNKMKHQLFGVLFLLCAISMAYNLFNTVIRYEEYPERIVSPEDWEKVGLSFTTSIPSPTSLWVKFRSLMEDLFLPYSLVVFQLS
jgi:hypothetical protein